MAAGGSAAKLRPRLPDGAAGAVLYRFAPPDGPGVAVQFEAVTADGSRVLVAVGRPGERRTAKRPTVIGSRFDGGMLAFVARPGAAGAVLHLAEGPIDALALVALERLGAGNLGGGGRRQNGGPRGGPARGGDSAPVAGTCGCGWRTETTGRTRRTLRRVKGERSTMAKDDGKRARALAALRKHAPALKRLSADPAGPGGPGVH